MKIVLVGAGPRGLLVLERLIAWHQTMPLQSLEITLIDPYPVGGRVWRVDQPAELLMNTAAQAITLFYDQSVNALGPFTPGPNLAQWAQTKAPAFLADIKPKSRQQRLLKEVASLKPNDYPSRALYGYYMRWVYAELLRRADLRITITTLQASVTAVIPQGPQYQVTTTNGQLLVDQVVMALGNLENTPTREQAELTRFAQINQRLYIPPNFPEEANLDAITADDVVVIRGLGLSFFDFMIRLSEGRGGRFSRDLNGELHYHPSGKEPRIIAGSRRGLPYHAKGRNQKAPGQEWQPHFLTPAQLAAWQSRPGHLSSATFFSALQHEVEWVYYSLLLPQRYPKLDLASFQEDFLQAPEAALSALAIKPKDRLDWDALLGKQASGQDVGSFQAVVKAYLKADVEAANLGTLTGPKTAALEVFRDLRNPIRQVIAQNLLSDDDYLDFFLREFNGLNDFLSIGPPAIRLEQLHALMVADIITIMPPTIQVTGQNGHFVTQSGHDPSIQFQGTVLIDARVPSANAPTAISPLLQQLQKADLATVYELQLQGGRRFQSGAIEVDRVTSQLKRQDGSLVPGLFLWGVPTEGFNWLTTASPRPYVNDVSLRSANQLVKALLAIPATN